MSMLWNVGNYAEVIPPLNLLIDSGKPQKYVEQN